MSFDPAVYNAIRDGRGGYFQQKRGLIAVWGTEAVQFLDGMITNDMKALADGDEMLAAFPNAQGRLLAVVRVLRQGEKFFIETEAATREKLYQNLFRFTFAGDFFIDDLSDQYGYFEIFGPREDVYNPNAGELFAGALAFELGHGAGYSIPVGLCGQFTSFLTVENGCIEIDDELYETLRIESGIPKYGVDMDETTIVPELGLAGMISYTKGCYIGQEIIARIHFRGHVAKQLTGLVLEFGSTDLFPPRGDLTSRDGKPAGRITSATYSPKLERYIALGLVRYDFLKAATELKIEEYNAVVRHLPFFP